MNFDSRPFIVNPGIDRWQTQVHNNRQSIDEVDVWGICLIAVLIMIN